MKIFVSPLTVYTYKNPEREVLNLEEVNKFRDAINYAGKFDKGIVFSEYSLEEIREVVSKLSDRERKEYLALLEDVKDGVQIIKVELTDYENSYGKMYDKIEDLMEAYAGKESMTFKVNVSCGHKMGSFALYLVMMDLAHDKRFYKYMGLRNQKPLIVDVYHAEKGVVESLPTVHFTSQRSINLDEYILYIPDSMDYEEFRKIFKDDADRNIIYMKKHGYIEMEDEKIYLTTKGKTLKSLLRNIN